ncbi:MAG: alpha-L-fucosidase [Anaerolineae bacterium]
MKEPSIYRPVPSVRQLAWHRREMHGFVHFTTNTFSNREWGYGDEAPSVFAPSSLDCRQWVAAAKAGGLRGLILTAKHHDGFCLWPTRTTPHNVSASPLREGRGDVVRELGDACREGGIEFGVYCSPWDRNHPAYGHLEYVHVYHAQWQELLADYGPLFECWFDGANGGDGFYGGAREKRAIDARTYYRFDDIWAACRRTQDSAVIFSDGGPDVRWCGNEAGFTGATSWSKVRPEGFAPGVIANMQRLVEGDADGSAWRGAECDVSIRPGWFWHPTEQPKTGDDLFAIWLASVGRGACLNLNITPDRRGLIPTADFLALTQFRQQVEAFIAIDLAGGLSVQASSTASGHANHLTDGDPDTWWEAEGTPAELVLDWGHEERVGGVRIEEAIQYGQRVSAFAVDVGRGGSWYEVARGATIGPRRILRLEAAKGSALRLRILASQAPAVLGRVFVYAG